MWMGIKVLISPIIQKGLQRNATTSLIIRYYLGRNWLSTESTVSTLLILVESRPEITAQRLAKREIAVYKFQRW